jgi:hypothetical protein
MGNKFMNPTLKKFATENYPDTKIDLFAMFIERNCELIKEGGSISMITMETWMFLSSFEKFRNNLLQKFDIVVLGHFPYDGKRPTIMGINFGTSAFILRKYIGIEYKSCYFCSRYYELKEDGHPLEFPTKNERYTLTSTANFKKIPGSPIAYWVSEKIIETFENGKLLGEIADARQGLATSDNDRFLRRWYEAPLTKIKFNATTREEAKNSQKKWFPYNKGGDFKKWYGNQEYLVNWENDGDEIRNFMGDNGKIRSAVRNENYYFKKSISWSFISSAIPAFRFFPSGFIFDVAGSSIFADEQSIQQKILGFCNTKIAIELLKLLNPTLNFQVGNITLLPLILEVECTGVSQLIDLSKSDWDNYETSWEFSENPLVKLSREMETEDVEDTFEN